MAVPLLGLGLYIADKHFHQPNVIIGFTLFDVRVHDSVLLHHLFRALGRKVQPEGVDGPQPEQAFNDMLRKIALPHFILGGKEIELVIINVGR